MRRETTPTRPRRGDSATGRTRCFAVAGQTIEVSPLTSGLYPVATPIGNLNDVTLRALEVLAGADVIACEDTRISRRLLDHYRIATPLTPYHEHNAAQARPRLLARIGEGAAVALISDAGTPLISDPGFKLVRAAREAGHLVSPIPGASAVLAALVASGLPSDRFFFEGFLPAKQVARRNRIDAIATIPATLILFETGPRLAATLADLAARLGSRPAAICRELTKLYEEIRGGDLVALAHDQERASAPRGEIVIVVALPDEHVDQVGDDDVDAMLRLALGRTSLKNAVSEVTAATGRPRRTVYQRALAIAKDRDNAAR